MKVLMLRPVLAAAAGYLTMAATVFVSLSIAYSVLGREFVFQGTSNQVTVEWTLAALLGGFLAALAGGYVAGRTGKSAESFLILVGGVLVLGVASATYSMVNRPEVVLEFEPTRWGLLEAARSALHPVWYDFLIPLLGALGVLWGGRRGCPETDA